MPLAKKQNFKNKSLTLIQLLQGTFENNSMKMFCVCSFPTDSTSFRFPVFSYFVVQ